MTFDPAARNLLAWHTVPCDYAPCSQPIGRRCVTTSGARTIPHAARLRALDWWLVGAASRDAEVAGLTTAMTDRDTLNADLQVALKTATDNAALLTDQLKTARAGAALVPGLQQQVADLLAKITAAQAQIANLQAQIDRDHETPDGFATAYKSEDFTDGKIPAWFAINDRFHMGGRDDLSLAANWSVVDGVLTNTMRRQSAVGSDGVTYAITTGMSFNKALLPAEFHLRCRLRADWTPGFWPGWPWFTNAMHDGGEVDPWECFYSTGRPKITLHSRAYGTGHLLEPFTPPAPSGHGPGDFYTLDVEHVVGADPYWKFWYDDTLVKTFDRTSKAWDDVYHNGASDKWNLILNTQSGASGGSVTAASVLPAKAELDYLRIWTR